MSSHKTATSLAVGAAAFTAIVGVFVAVMASVVIVRGFVLMYLWEWFMVPVFGLSNLTILQAYGLICVAGFLHPPQLDKKKDDSETPAWHRILVHGYLAPLVALVFGFIIHCMM